MAAVARTRPYTVDSRMVMGAEHAALLDRDRQDETLGGAAVILTDDDVLRDVDQTTGQVAGLSGLQRRIRQALAGPCEAMKYSRTESPSL